MPQQHTLGRKATTITREESFTVIRLYDTPVVQFNGQEVLLANGGHWTATTKTRMNQAANQFRLGFQVRQHKGDWFVVQEHGQGKFRPDGTYRIQRGIPSG